MTQDVIYLTAQRITPIQYIQTIVITWCDNYGQDEDSCLQIQL